MAPAALGTTPDGSTKRIIPTSIGSPSSVTFPEMVTELDSSPHPSMQIRQSVHPRIPIPGRENLRLITLSPYMEASKANGPDGAHAGSHVRVMMVDDASVTPGTWDVTGNRQLREEKQFLLPSWNQPPARWPSRYS